MLYAYRQRYLVLLIAFGLVPFWLWLALDNFALLTDRRDILPSSMEAHQNWVKFCQDFHYQNDFLLLAYDSQGSPSASGRQRPQGKSQEVIAAVEQLSQSLNADPAFQNVFYKIDAPLLADSALYYVSVEQLKQIESMLTAARPWLDDMAKPDGLKVLVERMGSLTAPALSTQVKPLLKILIKILDGLAQTIQTRGQEPYQSPFSEYQPEAEGLKNRNVQPGQKQFYYSLGDGKTYVIMARAAQPTSESLPKGLLPSKTSALLRNFSTQWDALLRLRSYVAQIQQAHPSVNVFITGEAAFETDEAHQALVDIGFCGFLGILFLCLVTLAVMRCPRALGCIVVSNLVAACWLLGLDSCLGPLNLLTAQHWFLFALASLWWSFHLVLRFLIQLRSAGCAAAGWDAVARSWAPEARWFLTASGLLWLSLILVGGPSLASLARYCLLALMVLTLEIGVLLPALISVAFSKNPESIASGLELQMPTRWILEIVTLAQNKGLSPLLQVLCLLSLVGLNQVKFQDNLLDLPPLSMAVKRVENYLEPIRYSTLYAFAVAENREQASDLRNRFLRLKAVGRCESINLLFPPHAGEKSQLVNRIIDIAKTIPVPLPAQPRNASQLLVLNQVFETSLAQLDKALAQLASSPDAQTRQDSQRLTAVIQRTRGHIDVSNPGPVEEGLFRYEDALNKDLQFMLDLLHHQNPQAPDVLDQLPAALKLRTVSPQGKILLRIYPTNDCWNLKDLYEFVAAVREVDPSVTGAPVLLNDFFHDLRHGLRQGLLLFLALSVIGGLLFRICLGKKRSSRIAATPSLLLIWGPPRIALPLLAGVFCLGLAGLWGLGLNALNLWLWLLSLHLGWLYSLAVLGSSRESAGEPAALAGSFLVVALFFLFAANEGIKTCGAMMSLGIACQLLTSCAWPRSYWCSRTDFSGPCLEEPEIKKEP